MGLEFKRSEQPEFEPIESILDRFLPDALDSPLSDPMRYATLSDGKRIRGRLVINSSRMGPERPAELIKRLAASVELIHAYSLVHDDLPAMDNDLFRRGQESCHSRFGEDVAILVGNSLMSLAFEIVGGLSFPGALDQIITPVEILSSITSHNSVPTGQYWDLKFEDYQPSKQEILEIYQLKTGELLGTSIQLGALAGGVKAPLARELNDVGTRLGIPYQVLNDCLELEAPVSNEHDGSLESDSSDSPLFNQIGIVPSLELSREILGEELNKIESIPLNTHTLRTFIKYLDDSLQRYL